MSCRWDKRLVIANRVAKLSNAGGPTTLTEQSIVRIPSPRLQCQISFPNTPAMIDGTQPWSWLQAATAVPSASWSLQPIAEPNQKGLPPGTIPPSVWTNYYVGVNVLGLGPQDMFPAFPAAASPQAYTPSYVISGEVNRLWLVAATLRFQGLGLVGPAYAILQAEFTPNPQITMTNEEWDYWVTQCSLTSLTSNDANPPTLTAAG